MMKAWKVILGSFVLTVALAGFSRSASAQFQCADGPIVNVTSVIKDFPVGSNWTFDVAIHPCQGLRFTYVHYKPAGGIPRRVMSIATIAQIHVPYATGTPRFLDLTTATTGMGNNALGHATGQCHGTTYGPGSPNGAVCIETVSEGYAWQWEGGFREKQMIVVSMSSQMGDYTYINRWEFHDDGKIEVKLGLTGMLQIVKDGSSYANYGGRLNPQSESPAKIGIAHWHNVYYRLDFDIDGTANDRVDRITWVPSTAPSPDGSCTTTGKCGTISFSPILTETAQATSLSSATSWFIYDKTVLNDDGRRIGYWLNPHSPHQHRGMTGGSEPWAGSELWVTQFNSCEQYAVENQQPFLPAFCGTGNATHVGTMTNGQSVDGQDIVVWFRNSILHVPRDEDQPFMPVEWMSFEIIPRSFHFENPAQ